MPQPHDSAPRSPGAFVIGRGVILLATYDGAAHLQAQLNSFAAQTCQDWDMIVSDDGSHDDSRAIVVNMGALWQAPPQSAAPSAPGSGCHALTLLDGPRRGFVRNFFHLLTQVPPTADWAALSDQDDVWFADKLERALVALSAVPPECPGLYCAGSLICDAALTPIRRSTRFHRPPDFRNALVQSVGGGNTMVLNRAALDLVREAACEAEDAAAHDWWLYQVISASGGTILRDPEPVLFYRQHGGNAIGANTSLRGRVYRVLFIMGRRFSTWNDINLRALNASRHRFTPKARQVLDSYAQARKGRPWTRLRALWASGVYRQSRRGSFALYLACLLNRL